jgi:ABC-type transporter Mla MlaB component
MRKNETSISIKRINLRKKKLERLRKKSSEKRKQLNIQRNCRKSYISEQKPKRNNQYQQKNRRITAKTNLSLINFPENVLSFIAEIENAASNSNIRIIILNMRAVEKIDIGGISILLSKINKMTQNNIQVICNLPVNEDCKKMFFESGFSDHMRDLQGRKINYSRTNNNLMVNRGFDKTSNEKLGLAIRNSVKHVTGTEDSFRPLYSIAQEMCANSIEHANQHNKNWLFSVWYKDEVDVCFTMIDIGSGILGTLKRKFSQQIRELVLTDNKEILLRAFEKKYSSVTKDINRNKGLPKIKNISDEKYINNLIVITNNVLLDFTNNSNSKILNKKFNGTLYYWELNKKCIEVWKNRSL